MHSFPNLEPFHCSMSGSTCCFLTCIQVSQETGKVVWYPHLIQNFPEFVVTHNKQSKRLECSQWSRSKCFSGFSCFFYDPTGVGNLICGSSAFSKSGLYIWKFSVQVLLKPSLENFEHYFGCMWNECNCSVVEHSLALPFFGIRMKTDFSHPVVTASFPNLLAYWVQHFDSIIFQDLK